MDWKLVSIGRSTEISSKSGHTVQLSLFEWFLQKVDPKIHWTRHMTYDLSVVDVTNLFLEDIWKI